MEYYDAIAKSYNELYCKEQLEKWEAAKGLIPIKGLVLDAGCGTGIITEKLGNVVGIDSSIELLKLCGKTLRTACADINSLPFRDETFNTIVSFTVLQDVKDAAVCVSELRRVLKKNGHFLITVLDKNKVGAVREELKKKFGKIRETKVRNDLAFYF